MLMEFLLKYKKMIFFREKGTNFPAVPYFMPQNFTVIIYIAIIILSYILLLMRTNKKLIYKS